MTPQVSTVPVLEGPARKNVRHGTVAVVGLGYVGLPLAVALAGKKIPTIGLDINPHRIKELRNGKDVTGEVSGDELEGVALKLDTDPTVLAEADVIIIGVPTPIDGNRQPDLGPLKAATRTVARHMKRGATIIYESTVYPGVTEEICAPILCGVSGLEREHFSLAYSPERINPGDKVHTLKNVRKVVSGDSAETLERVAALYSEVVDVGVFRATSIRVAEAAKVIENVQRDINIALMNELAIIFERLDIRTKDVLEAAGSKWNFSRYSPGLVGGHCIGVDPYYLTAKAESVGYHPEMILAGRRLNDGMAAFVAQKTVKMLIAQDIPVKGARIGVLGVTFKENVSDYRNSKVFAMIDELRSFGIEVVVHDPRVCRQSVEKSHGLAIVDLEELVELDGITLAVPHSMYLTKSFADLRWRYRANGIFVDIKAAFGGELPSDCGCWSL